MKNTLLILIFALFFFYVVPADAHESTTDKIAIIHVTENGYDPQELTVAVGTTVVFENTGASNHWPATDHHPSHSEYDDTTLEEHCQPTAEQSFDACTAVKPGEEYSFTFSKAGTFPYHDHLWPHLVGVIHVEEAPQEDNSSTQSEVVQVPEVIEHTSLFQKIITYIHSQFVALKRNFSPEKTANILLPAETHTELYESNEHYYEQLVQDLDPKQAILTLQENSQQDEKVNGLCHDMLHVIGHAAYEKYGGFS